MATLAVQITPFSEDPQDLEINSSTHDTEQVQLQIQPAWLPIPAPPL